MKDSVITEVSQPESDARRLTQAGISPTPQRLAIARVLFTGQQHVTAEDVYLRVNLEREAKGVSKATVYNTLGLFVKKGLLREVFVEASSVFYDTNTRPHHHFYNLDSGRLTDIDERLVPLVLESELPENTRLEGVDVMIKVRNRS
jgi:Fur family transcriptional regulator, iron response regulator